MDSKENSRVFLIAYLAFHSCYPSPAFLSTLGEWKDGKCNKSREDYKSFHGPIVDSLYLRTGEK